MHHPKPTPAKPLILALVVLLLAPAASQAAPNSRAKQLEPVIHCPAPEVARPAPVLPRWLRALLYRHR